MIFGPGLSLVWARAHHSTSLRFSVLSGRIKMSQLSHFSNCHVVKVPYSSSTCQDFYGDMKTDMILPLPLRNTKRGDVMETGIWGQVIECFWKEKVLKYKYELVKKMGEEKIRASQTEDTALRKGNALCECKMLGDLPVIQLTETERKSQSWGWKGRQNPDYWE